MCINKVLKQYLNKSEVDINIEHQLSNENYQPNEMLGNYDRQAKSFSGDRNLRMKKFDNTRLHVNTYIYTYSIILTYRIIHTY